MNLKDARKRLDELAHKLETSAISLRDANKILSEERYRDVAAIQLVVEELERLEEKPVTGEGITCAVCGV